VNNGRSVYDDYYSSVTNAPVDVDMVKGPTFLFVVIDLFSKNDKPIVSSSLVVTFRKLLDFLVNERPDGLDLGVGFIPLDVIPPEKPMTLALVILGVVIAVLEAKRLCCCV